MSKKTAIEMSISQCSLLLRCYLKRAEASNQPPWVDDLFYVFVQIDVCNEAQDYACQAAPKVAVAGTLSLAVDYKYYYTYKNKYYS